MSESRIGPGFGTKRPEPALPPQLPPHVVPRMANADLLPAVEPPKVWRVRDAELDELGAWLKPLLLNRWPRLNEEGFGYMLKAATTDKRTLFARTQNICGLFHVEPDCFEPAGIVREKFCRSRERGNSEEQAIFYRYARDWAKQISAVEFRFGENSNCALDKIASVLQDVRINSNVKDRRNYWVILSE